MTKSLVIFGVTVLLNCFQSVFGGQCLKSSYVMAWTPMAPYMIPVQEGQVEGLDVRFIQSVFKLLDCKLKLVQLPWKRSLYEVQKGRVDFMGMASLTAERQQFARYSTPYRLEQIRIGIRKGERSRWKIAVLEDLIELNMRLNVQLGAWYGAAYAKAMKLEGFQALVREDTNNRKQMFRLLNNRADGVLNDVLYFDYFAAQHGKAQQIEFLPFIVHDNPVHFIFSKTSISQADFENLNDAIKKLRRKLFISNYTNNQSLLTLKSIKERACFLIFVLIFLL